MSLDDENPSIGSRAILRGSKVWLRAFERADLDAYTLAINDVDVAYWAGYSAPQSSDKVQDWYEKRVRVQHSKDAYFFVISPLGSNDLTRSRCPCFVPIGTVWTVSAVGSMEKQQSATNTAWSSSCPQQETQTVAR
jgi:hypothetical protein